MHQLRTTFLAPGPRGWRKEIVIDIDPEDYDPENYTMGSLVWDAWTVDTWPVLRLILDNVDLTEDHRVTVEFDGTFIADEFAHHVTEDEFTAAWVAQHDEPLSEVS